MTQTSSGGIHAFRSTTIADAIGDALNHLLVDPERGGEDQFTLVFTGEATTTESALRAAIADIRALAIDHRGIPTGITVNGMMKTDGGTRIWGSMSCAPGTRDEWADPETLEITMEHEGPTEWTLTIGRI